MEPLLFNIYLNDLFFINIDICKFADDNTLHLCDLSLDALDALVHKLEVSAKSVIKWFDYNYMKLNESKCKLLISGNKEEFIIATVGSAKSLKVTLLGCHIDRELKLNDHVSNKYKTAEKKVNALIRLCNILLFHRKRLLMKAFIESQFAYCPLVGLFHSRALNTKINLLHCRAFVHQDELSTSQELLIKDNSVSVHHRNIQCTLIFIITIILRLFDLEQKLYVP